MRKTLETLLCLILSPLLIAQESMTPSDVVQLPRNTAIHLKLDQDVSSATIHKGDKVRYIVAEDVIVNGVVAIPAGTAVFRKVDVVQPSITSDSCRNEVNGWFSLGDPDLRSSSGRRMKVTLLPPGSFPKKPMSAREKALTVAAVPLQVVAIAIWIAAPAVLIPVGIATGIHDQVHRPPAHSAPAASPKPSAAPLRPATPAASSGPTAPTIVTEPLNSPMASVPPQPVPCLGMAHNEEWKAREAKIMTYYLVHSYTVRAGDRTATAQPKGAKETR